jgi:hypothetical protein
MLRGSDQIGLAERHTVPRCGRRRATRWIIALRSQRWQPIACWCRPLSDFRQPGDFDIRCCPVAVLVGGMSEDEILSAMALVIATRDAAPASRGGVRLSVALC